MSGKLFTYGLIFITLASAIFGNLVFLEDVNEKINKYKLVKKTTMDLGDKIIELQDGLLAAVNGTNIVIIDLDDEKVVAKLSGHEMGVKALFQLKKGLIVSASEEYNSIKIWDPKRNYECIKTMTAITPVHLFTEFEGLLVSAGTDYISFWDPENDFKEVRKLYAQRIGHVLTVLKNGLIAYTTDTWYTSYLILMNPKDNFAIVKQIEYAAVKRSGMMSFIFEVRELSNGLIAALSNEIRLLDPENNYGIVKTEKSIGFAMNHIIEVDNGLLVAASQGDLGFYNPETNYDIFQYTHENLGGLKSIFKLKNGMICAHASTNIICWSNQN